MEAEKNIAEVEWNIQPMYKDETNEIFSIDDIIDAYLGGKIDILKKFEDKAVGEAFGKNLKLAKEASVRFYHNLLNSGIKSEKVYLKVKDKERFNALFLIDEDQWCDDEFDEKYLEAKDLKSELNSNSFDYSIILMPKSTSFDKASLLSDGYLLSYGV
ncbi:MAG: hypothetical protein EP305_00010 [Bacteroidetes bacterium]|nr:MAG: hypothetical protein EP305_00010 [Bacteroidota bacterium]